MIFVEGVPGSGITALAGLLAAHPNVAGIWGEPHLFDLGVNRLFDSHDGIGEDAGQLTFLSRAELVDLIRDLADGVVAGMRSRSGSHATFAVEATPVASAQPDLILRRQLECFPDAWYIHLVRDRDTVVRSLMRAPWNPDRSRRACVRWREEGVMATRNALGGHSRYREVRHEDLASNPVSLVADLFAWLGLKTDTASLDHIAVLSKDPPSSSEPAALERDWPPSEFSAPDDDTEGRNALGRRKRV